MSQKYIVIKGARENNLKNVNVKIPKDKFVIMTGASGSGKSSLAFDTIYAEGQRRYMESLSAYARQFLGNSEKPDVDQIDGLSPAIAIDQKTTSNNPRSTVGTATEIYDYLRLLYARIGVPYCPHHHIPITGSTIKEMIDKIMELPDGTRCTILSPIVSGKKGMHKDLIEKLIKEGYVRARIDGEIQYLEEVGPLEKNKKHNIDVVVDRIVKKDNRSRFHDSLETALNLSDGLAVLLTKEQETLFSSNYACKICGFSVPKLEPKLFSFNAPYGACPTCKGLGITQKVDLNLLMPDRSLSINQGGIRYYKNIVNTENLEWQRMKNLIDFYHIDMDTPIEDLPADQLDKILYGSDVPIAYTLHSRSGIVQQKNEYIEGVCPMIERRYQETGSAFSREWYGSFISDQECPTCHGARLNEQVLSVQVGGKNIYEWTQMSIKEARAFMKNLDLDPTDAKIANLIVREISNRLEFLDHVGLGYLSLDRLAGTLSGGEAQRIRLATQIGSKLTGVMYVLDEPSIGLHQRDNDRLIDALKEMRDLGNTLIVVEHDEDTMRASDYIVDVGPGAGIHGGEIVAVGTPEEIMANPNSLTGAYLSGRKRIEVPTKRRRGNGKKLRVVQATQNNLKKVTVDFKLGTFTVVTGVSGSGKSSLVTEVLTRGIQHKLGRAHVTPGRCKAIKGMENIDKIVEISQDPIGRTPRSNPATYTGVFDDIRALYAQTKEARMLGYDKGRFSFNVKGGRCEACQGDGILRISMQFLPDVYVTCDQCGGTRYNEETLQVRYKGKNIAEVLDMTVEEALDFFSNISKIRHKLQTLNDVGLSYIKLGQPATTLSGGEAQRIKLASQLQKKPTGKTLFVLDEPTTGLHSDDVNKLISVLQRLVDHGDTVIVIEHNLDVIKCADWLIDLGPEGGDEGGTVVVTGTPETVSQCENSYTGQYLKPLLERGK
ncbi:excinuclease ABC subunit UvrA [Catenisphaera adipataccumulans]|uniref:UvrABC system protein A n=1 Tax=Catenisphaera adipataccumulans TaxID=700500 RepID=A0A7W8CXW4_9FIRM|nr:excinuclease ABC subunit UvrA [Catenisphaera adipataccumulans]MBB5182463.1 excinuclease ABC subunit A [Catenisphaera adipataccumulans]